MQVFVTGDEVAGKSSFIDRCADDTFREEHFPHVRDFIAMTVMVGQSRVKLQVVRWKAQTAWQRQVKWKE